MSSTRYVSSDYAMGTFETSLTKPTLVDKISVLLVPSDYAMGTFETTLTKPTLVDEISVLLVDEISVLW